MMFNLGDKLKDRVTGFEGIVIARSEWLNGCKQYCLKPPVDKDGKVQSGEWIDQEQLKLVKEGAVAVDAKPTGGPQGDAPAA